jgi:hypothetical protein
MPFPMLSWEEVLSSNAGNAPTFPKNVSRAKVPGGWLVYTEEEYDEEVVRTHSPLYPTASTNGVVRTEYAQRSFRVRKNVTTRSTWPRVCRDLTPIHLSYC